MIPPLPTSSGTRTHLNDRTGRSNRVFPFLVTLCRVTVPRTRRQLLRMAGKNCIIMVYGTTMSLGIRTCCRVSASLFIAAAEKVHVLATT